MTRTAILATLLIGMAGCATQPPLEWQKPGATAAMAEQDEQQCDYEAGLATAPMMASDPFQAGWNRGTLSLQCMKVKGWQRGPQAG